MQNNTPEERGCQSPTGKKELSSSAQFYADGQKERIATRSVLIEKSQEGLTTSDLNAIVEEIGGKSITFPSNFINGKPMENTKNLIETKKLIETFNDNLKNYPKVLTYEGSVVFCVAIAVNEGESINIEGLPSVDRELILSQLPTDAFKKMNHFNAAHLNVRFDNTRD